MKILSLASRYVRALLDLLLPRMCIVCGEKLLIDERHLCLECLMNLPYTHFWERSHNPMADKFNAVLQLRIDEGTLENERYSYACALFFYNNDTDFIHIPYQLKYHGNIPVGKIFGKILGMRIAESRHMRDIDLVLPVPLHWRRKWERGYNQAEVIAKEIADTLDTEMRNDILTRTRYTKTQTRKSIEEKASNVEKAFAIGKRYQPSKAPSWKHILIVDDIFTSGSTAMACYTALRSVFPPDVRISVATLGFVGRA